MIPNAVASTGPYAGLWSHLKSIDHALGRALDSGSLKKLTELDRERIHALTELFRRGLVSSGLSSHVQTDLLVYSQGGDPEYASALELKERIPAVAAFQNWKSARNLGFEKKVQLLIEKAEAFLNKPSSLFPKDAPREEFEVLRAIVQSLISDAEAALQ